MNRSPHEIIRSWPSPRLVSGSIATATPSGWRGPGPPGRGNGHSRRCFVGHVLGRRGRRPARFGPRNRGPGPESLPDGAVRHPVPGRRRRARSTSTAWRRASRAARVRVRHRGLRPLVLAPAEVPALSTSCRHWRPWRRRRRRAARHGRRRLRVKESDRISALAAGLRAMGGDIEEFPDGFHVRGDRRLTGGRPDAVGDHRSPWPLRLPASRRPATPSSAAPKSPCSLVVPSRGRPCGGPPR